MIKPKAVEQVALHLCRAAQLAVTQLTFNAVPLISMLQWPYVVCAQLNAVETEMIIRFKYHIADAAGAA